MIDNFDCGVVTFTQTEFAGLTWVRHDATNKNKKSLTRSEIRTILSLCIYCIYFLLLISFLSIMSSLKRFVSSTAGSGQHNDTSLLKENIS
jgi:hypothetical protein